MLFDPEKRVVYRKRESEGTETVSIVSGGGSGHEPGFAGYVGRGCLTASVAGSIFASPAAEQIRAAILSHIPTRRGVLVLVLNYTGDVLNFGIAAEKARANGIQVEHLVIGDDVSVGRTKGAKVGRRGIAGAILVAKIAGAVAELGYALSDVYRVTKLAADNIVSIGSSMDHCHVPGRAVDEGDQLTVSTEVEVGMGIHNEPGTCRVAASLPELVSIMLAQLLDVHDAERHFIDIASTDDVVLFINNLGGVSVLEMGAITTEVCSQLFHKYGLTPVRVITGMFLTSLNGFGWSMTLLRLCDNSLGPGRSFFDLLNAPAEVAGWSGAAAVTTAPRMTLPTEVFKQLSLNGVYKEAESPGSLSIDLPKAYSVLKAGLEKAVASEAEVTKYDTILGDGDCGTNLKKNS